MNKYRLSPDVYNRTYDKPISTEEIKDKLVGDKAIEIIDIDDREVDKDGRLQNAIMV